jgi:hypothetical protein
MAERVHGPLEEALTRDQILTNVMFYWVARTAGSAARLVEARLRCRDQSAADARCGRIHRGQGGGIIGGDKEEDIPRTHDVRRGDPVDHHSTALRAHLAVTSDCRLRGRPLGLCREQEHVDRRFVARTSQRSGWLLRNSGKPEDTGQTSPCPISGVEVVGHVHDGDTATPKRVGHGCEVDLTRGG